MSGTMTVVIPTYNEELNIARMAKALREAYPEFKVLFMDDNSTDSSRQLIEDLHDPMVTFYPRSKKRGLAASVLEGFEIADTDYVMCMDCDFQHPLSSLQGIYDEMEKGAELCVGVRNGRTSMGYVRAFGSKAVETFCKVFFNIHGKQTTKDMMSGLFAIRCDVFRPVIQANWGNIEYRGWKVLMDLMKYMDRKVKVSYVRYDFASREEGESHISPLVPIMTFHQLWGFGKFLSKVLCKVYKRDYKELYPDERGRT